MSVNKERPSYSEYLFKPFLDPLPNEDVRLKRSLLLLSISATLLFSGYSKADFSGLTILGIHFTTLSNENIAGLLLSVILYLQIHYNWSIWSYWTEHRLRLSGLRVYSGSHETQKITEKLPLTDPGVHESRQSTLLSWWRGQEDYHDEVANMKSAITGGLNPPRTSAEVQQRIDMLRTCMNGTKHQYDLMTDMLERFDKGFWHFQRQQSLRFTLFDFVLPNLFAVVSLYFLALSTFTTQ